MTSTPRILLLILLLTVTFSISSRVQAQDAESADSSAEAAEQTVDTAAPAEEAPAAAESRMIKAIEITGNTTISTAKILTQIKSRVGLQYLETVVSEDIKRLYNTGYFTDVRSEIEDQDGGTKLIFEVQEKPVIGDITFSDIKRFKKDNLLKEIKTKPGDFLDNKQIKEDVKTLQDFYAKKGMTDAIIESEIHLDDVLHKADVHFAITEGRKIKIKIIDILGNQAFKDRRIKKLMKTKKDNIFRSGRLKEDVLKEDTRRIEAFYEQRGYIDATADYDIEYLSEGKVKINVEVIEGGQYFIGEVTISGYQIVSREEIDEAIKNLKTGKVFSRAKMEEDINAIRTLYFDKGYIFARVEDRTSIIPETGQVAVDLQITEGEEAYVGEVKIQGNARTRDIVIRREIRLFPGDKFEGKKLKRSRERLQNLQYFEEIDFNIEDTDVTNVKDLVVDVKEAKTGSFSFGGGFSSVDKLIGFFEIEQKNFDISNWPHLTGGGQQLAFRAETGSNRSNFKLSFTEPWIRDYPVSGGFDLYVADKRRDRDVGYIFDEKRAGLVLRLGKEFTEYFSAGISYKYEQVKISDIEVGVSADILAEEGKNNISSISNVLTYDKRDSKVAPTEGWYVTNTFDLAGGLFSGDKDFYREQLRGSYYIPIEVDKYDWLSVLELSGRVGVADAYGDSAKVPIFERFFAGGAYTIRGYEERSVGPFDPGSFDPTGGESMIVGSLEYTIPVIDFMKLAFFYDFGNVWAKASDIASGGYKSGIGSGVRVKTPIGPINLDYGYPLDDPSNGDGKQGQFYFSISRGF